MSQSVEKTFSHSIFVPHDPTVGLYLGAFHGHTTPWVYTGWKDEIGAMKKSCYLHGGLNPTTTYKIKGPDALEFLSHVCVNGFSNFPIGSGKHAIMCNEKGQVMQDGVLVREGEEEFITYWLDPYISYALEKSDYNAVGENVTGKVFLFQLAGPRSLEILEAATGDDLHDLKFMHSKMSHIGDAKFRVLRMGMGGALAYELHGDVEDARFVYSALLEAGEEFGIRRLSASSYGLNHTQSGFSQSGIHFIQPWPEDKEFSEHLLNSGMKGAPRRGSLMPRRMAGSLGSDPTLRYFTAVELGWTKMIKFDHDFVGRAALEKEVANPSRTMVTLVWNKDDIMDVYASQFQSGEEYRYMEIPGEPAWESGGGITIFSDKVMKNDRMVGISSGRVFSYYAREMISLCTLNIEYAEIGTEVLVLWGEPGSRQKEIRATVSHFPFINKDRNQDVDTSTIPRRK